MITTLIEYKNKLDYILEDTTLTESQVDTLVHVIKENPNITPQEFYEIAIEIDKHDKIIFDGYKEYSFDPILNESSSTNLLEIVLPIINKYIPESVLSHMSNTAIVNLIEQILEVNVEDMTNISKRIDEMFSAGDISIPVQGLEKEPRSLEIITNGVFAPMLYKSIQFDKQMYKNDKSRKLKDIINDEKESNSPIIELIPTILIKLKKLDSYSMH